MCYLRDHCSSPEESGITAHPVTGFSSFVQILVETVCLKRTVWPHKLPEPLPRIHRGEAA